MSTNIVDEDDLDGRADIIASLETLLCAARSGSLTGIVLVSIHHGTDYVPYWATAETCPHAGAVLRAAASWLITRMDADALKIAMTRERETDPRLS